jgi:DNA-binding NarL/FixJ family response regulator
MKISQMVELMRAEGIPANMCAVRKYCKREQKSGDVVGYYTSWFDYRASFYDEKVKPHFRKYYNRDRIISSMLRTGTPVAEIAKAMGVTTNCIRYRILRIIKCQ